MPKQTKRKPRFATNANRGVRKLPARPGRPNPFGVQWSEQQPDQATGTLKRAVRSKFFPTEELRDAHFTHLCAEKRRGYLATMTSAEVADWRAFQAATGGTPWPEVVAGWQAHQISTGTTRHRLSVNEAVRDYLARYAKRVQAGQLSEASGRKVRRHIGRFAEAFNAQSVDAVAAEEIEDWIDDLDDVEAEATFNTYRRDLHAFFARLVELGAVRRNPLNSVPLRDELGETGVPGVVELARVLATCVDYFDPRHGHRFHRILARIALETFAGLRTSAARRVEKSDVNFEDRGITLPKRKAKNKRRHYVSGQPAVLWEWLMLAPTEAWAPIEAREYRYLKGELMSASGVAMPKNGLRHGFASYLLAHCKEPGRVAYLLSHRNEQELWDHYHGKVTQRSARVWMRLSPRWARWFRRLHAGAPARSLG
jgi:integrase